MNLTAILATLLAAAVAFGAWQYVRANGLANDLDTCMAYRDTRERIDNAPTVDSVDDAVRSLCREAGRSDCPL